MSIVRDAGYSAATRVPCPLRCSAKPTRGSAPGAHVLEPLHLTPDLCAPPGCRSLFSILYSLSSFLVLLCVWPRSHRRTELVFQDSGTGWIPPSPLVQFKLYQGEVFQYKPGASDPRSVLLRDSCRPGALGGAMSAPVGGAAAPAATDAADPRGGAGGDWRGRPTRARIRDTLTGARAAGRCTVRMSAGLTALPPAATAVPREREGVPIRPPAIAGRTGDCSMPAPDAPAIRPRPPTPALARPLPTLPRSVPE